ncbi:MAG: hypothetical protein ACK4RV_02245 [Caulobacter sp.]
MADKFYGVALGGKLAKDVTKNTSTTGAVMEFRVEQAVAGMTRQDVLNALEAVTHKIIEDTFPAS